MAKDPVLSIKASPNLTEALSHFGTQTFQFGTQTFHFGTQVNNKIL